MKWPRVAAVPVCLAFAVLALGQTSVRVNVGGPQYTDSNGVVWQADTGCTGGTPFATGNIITGTSDPTLYQTGQVGQNFSCTYAVTGPAFYYVTIRLAETQANISVRNPRIFNFFINNTFQRTINIIGQGGLANAASDYTFGPVAIYGSSISLLFATVSQPAEVQAIDIEFAAPIFGQTILTGYGTGGPFCTSFNPDGIQLLTANQLHELSGADCYGDWFVRSELGGTYKKKAALYAGNGATGQGLDLSSDATINWHGGDNLDVSTDDTCVTRSTATVVLATTLTLNICDPAANHASFSGKSYILDPGSESRPSCDVTKRGWLWATRGASMAADTVAVCAKDGMDAYAWRTIY